MEKSKVQQAIDARKKRVADLQAASDAKKSAAMTKRRGYAAKGTTTIGAGTGMGIAKYATPNYQQTALKKAAEPKRNLMPTETASNARQYEAERSDRPKKAATPKAPTTAQKRAASMSAPSVAKPKTLGLGVAGLAKAATKGVSVTPSRTYTEKEKQINAVMMDGKKKNGTMKASAQRKIQNLRKK